MFDNVSRYYITYHQWNSKPEFIVATHKVVNYREVLNKTNNPEKDNDDTQTEKQSIKNHSFRSGSPTWSSRSSLCGSDRTGKFFYIFYIIIIVQWIFSWRQIFAILFAKTDSTRHTNSIE